MGKNKTKNKINIAVSSQISHLVVLFYYNLNKSPISFLRIVTVPSISNDLSINSNVISYKCLRNIK